MKNNKIKIYGFEEAFENCKRNGTVYRSCKNLNNVMELSKRGNPQVYDVKGNDFEIDKLWVSASDLILSQYNEFEIVELLISSKELKNNSKYTDLTIEEINFREKAMLEALKRIYES